MQDHRAERGDFSKRDPSETQNSCVRIEFVRK